VTLYVHPERVKRGQLLWLEIEQSIKVVCRVNRVHRRAERAEVEIFASNNLLLTVDFNRLFEEST